MREVEQQHRDHGRRGEENDRGHETGEILADYEHFPSHRAEKVVMQTAVDQFTAEQVHEDPRTTEKDDGAQDETVIEDGVDLAVVVEVLPVVAGRLEYCQYHQWEQRQEREQVDQERAAAEKV